jgi:hypothetical protein
LSRRTADGLGSRLSGSNAASDNNRSMPERLSPLGRKPA